MFSIVDCSYFVSDRKTITKVISRACVLVIMMSLAVGRPAGMIFHGSIGSVRIHNSAIAVPESGFRVLFVFAVAGLSSFLHYQQQLPALAKADVTVVGISGDQVATQQLFASPRHDSHRVLATAIELASR